MMPSYKLDPAWLPPGTVVGPWKIKAWHGGGSFGEVFRAVRAAREHGGWVALKVARLPGDPRFLREAELLSRIQHPSVPRLLGRGEWQHPSGVAYPYVAMEWAEGLPLYSWGERFSPTSSQVSRVLAQLARALEATHAVGGVHRDVKGDNLLVNPKGSQAFLTDFGASNYAGAERLTREGLPPGTAAYRSPEAWEFELHRPRNSTAVYAVQPADDVFALGVSAYRLVTGAYLPPVEVREEAPGPGRLEWTPPKPPHELDPRVDSGLSTLILRMLSVRPEERPGAGELAEALEAIARRPASVAERPLLERESLGSPVEAPPAQQQQAPEPERHPAPSGRTRARAAVPAWLGYLASSVLGGVIAAMAVGWALMLWTGEKGGTVPSRSEASRRDGESVGLGDTGLTAPMAQEDALSGRRRLGLPLPEGPLDGQRRAPNCRPPVEVSINGGCWIRVGNVKPPCGDMSYEWKGNCYAPNYEPPRKPTSEPP